MKVLNKESIFDKEEVRHTLNERKLLGLAEHPFLAKLHYAFQSEDKLFLVMHYAKGGELFAHIRRKKRFAESTARLLMAEVCLGLEQLHSLGYVYRDLKPENVLLDEDGHIRLTDFGFSRVMHDETKAHTMCGTPEYIAPEVILCKSYGKQVDWWSFGAMLYALLVGGPPFTSPNRKDLFDKIVNAEPEIPEFVNLDAAHLITKLLMKDPALRLGAKLGAQEIKSHKFFKNIQWDDLMKKKIKPEYIPPKISEIDVPAQIAATENVLSSPPNPALISASEQRMFANFSYATTATASIPSGSASLHLSAEGFGEHTKALTLGEN